MNVQKTPVKDQYNETSTNFDLLEIQNQFVGWALFELLRVRQRDVNFSFLCWDSQRGGNSFKSKRIPKLSSGIA